MKLLRLNVQMIINTIQCRKRIKGRNSGTVYRQRRRDPMLLVNVLGLGNTWIGRISHSSMRYCNDLAFSLVNRC